MSEFKGGKHCNNGVNCPKSGIFGENWQYNSILLKIMSQLQGRGEGSTKI